MTTPLSPFLSVSLNGVQCVDQSLSLLYYFIPYPLKYDGDITQIYEVDVLKYKIKNT